METPNLFDLSIDGESSVFLSEVSRWARFLAVLGFVISGLLLLLGLLMVLGGSIFIPSDAAVNPLPVTIIGCVYAFFGGISIIPCNYLFQSARKMKQALRLSDQAMLNSSFMKLKSYFKFVGIFTIAMVVLCILLALNFLTFPG